jgi:hypothetical protein
MPIGTLGRHDAEKEQQDIKALATAVVQRKTA